MSSTRGNKKDNRSIGSILLLGLLVLTLCLSICLVHMADVKQVFEKVKVEESYQGIQMTENLVSDYVKNTEDMVRQAAILMTADKKELQSEDIFSIIQQFSTLEEFDNIYYLSNEGLLYRTDGEIQQEDPTEIAHIVSTTEPRCFVHYEESYSICPGMMYYVAPVRMDGKKTGQIIGAQNMKHFMDSSVLSRMKEQGDIVLISPKGDVYARAADQYKFTKHNNFFGFLSEISADTYARNSVNTAQSGLYKKEYEKFNIVDKDGMRDYVEILRVSNVDEVYLAYIYPETVLTNMIHPVLSESLITCLMIIGIMLGMLFFVWFTSKRASDTIEMLAYGDPITGGKNDNYFRNVAANVIWENVDVPYLVVRFDVSNFRYINEAYGHVRADELLSIIVEESKKHFKGREFCARMNADQFVLLARNDHEFEIKCEEMTSVINDRAREIGIMFPIRLKRGIYAIRKGDNDISIIIDRANAARKSLSGDEKDLVAIYSDKIVKQMYVEEKIESEMEEAMRTGEFNVFIQPKWDIVNDCIYGGEALVRWIKADGSMVYPDQFIPVFERNGFIEKLDLYMLEEVCKKLRMLMDENRTIFPISVNQSRILLHNPDYINQVSKIMKRYRIPKGYIELEITETVFLDERRQMISTMNQLKDMDVSISMDDFGSGYSSLNMLKDVPFDVIKIDREFFSEVITSQASILILRKIVEMAEGLGIRVLCEGVETAEQVEILKELGCYYVQGYYYSKPMDSAAFMEKYCSDKKGGKLYYDSLYEKESAERLQRVTKETSSKEEFSVASVVEQFKKSYVAPASGKKTKMLLEDDDGKMISVAERRIKASEAKKDEQTKLPKNS